MDRLARCVSSSWGWRRNAIAFAAGAFAALAQAPFYWLPTLFISYPVLALLLDGAAANGTSWNRCIRSSFVIGWMFGFGYFLAGLWWLGMAYTSQGDVFGPLLPLAIVLAAAGLPAVLAIFTGFGTVIARLLWTGRGDRILALTVGLALADYLRGHILTGFPWNLPGQVLAADPVLMQIYALVGPDGASFLVVLIAASLAGPLLPTVNQRRAWGGLLTGGGCLIFLVGFGAYRLSDAPHSYHDAVRLRIVQPSIPLEASLSASKKQSIFNELIDLSSQRTSPENAGLVDRTHVIWPESVIPFLLAQSPDQLHQLTSALPQGTTLIAGGARAAYGDTAPLYYNSAFVVSGQRRIIDAYDKVHLVPFGEYIPWPFASLVRALGLRQLTGFVDNSYSPGEGVRTMMIPGAPTAAILICYEIAFADEGVDQDHRPGWIISISDDAWYGRTPGPYQHLALAKLRAVAEGLPVIRSANNGISAIIDPYGRADMMSQLDQRTVLDGKLPQFLPATTNSRFGRLITLTIFAIGIMKLSTFFRNSKATG